MAQGTLEERVAYLEGKVDEQSRGYRELREDVQQLAARVDALGHKVDRFREELVGRIDAVDQRLSGRIDALDHRLSSRMDALDQKVDRLREELSARINALDQKVDRHFLWLIRALIISILVPIALRFVEP